MTAPTSHQVEHALLDAERLLDDDRLDGDSAALRLAQTHENQALYAAAIILAHTDDPDNENVAWLELVARAWELGAEPLAQFPTPERVRNALLLAVGLGPDDCAPGPELDDAAAKLLTWVRPNIIVSARQTLLGAVNGSAQTRNEKVGLAVMTRALELAGVAT